ncbi:MAG: serine/threonine-protein kinase [Bacteroidia bacterium]
MTIDKYQILRELASGGMGKVYVAQHLYLGNLVVIKTLLPEYAQNEQLAQRFYTEARIMAGLDHPAIVKLYDFFIESGVPYLIMEYVQGTSLEEILSSRPAAPLGIDWVIDNLSTIFDALDYIHSKGIVHRDIKPSNIMILPGGGAKLIDFGIAKAMDAEYKLTQTGTHLGTALYMAPEQITGAAVSPQTDIYALGLILYQCIFGRYPWPWEGKTLFQIYQTILTEKPYIPEEAPESLRLFFEQALAKDPEERYRQAGSMRFALAATRLLLASPTRQELSPAEPAELKGNNLPATDSAETAPSQLSGLSLYSRELEQLVAKERRNALLAGILSVVVGIIAGYFLRSPAGVVGWISWGSLVGGLTYLLLGKVATFRTLSYVGVGFFGSLLAYFYLIALPKYRSKCETQSIIYHALLTEVERYKADSLLPEIRRRLRVRGIEPQDLRIEVAPLPMPPSPVEGQMSLREFMRTLRGSVREVYRVRDQILLSPRISYKKFSARRYSQEISCTVRCGFFGLSTCYGTKIVWFLASWQESCTLDGRLRISYEYDPETGKLSRTFSPDFEDAMNCEEIPGTRTKRIEYQGDCIY